MKEGLGALLSIKERRETHFVSSGKLLQLHAYPIFSP
jgi:hypothetical protein